MKEKDAEDERRHGGQHRNERQVEGPLFHEVNGRYVGCQRGDKAAMVDTGPGRRQRDVRLFLRRQGRSLRFYAVTPYQEAEKKPWPALPFQR